MEDGRWKSCHSALRIPHSALVWAPASRVLFSASRRRHVFHHQDTKTRRRAGEMRRGWKMEDGRWKSRHSALRIPHSALGWCTCLACCFRRPAENHSTQRRQGAEAHGLPMRDGLLGTDGSAIPLLTELLGDAWARLQRWRTCGAQPADLLRANGFPQHPGARGAASQRNGDGNSPLPPRLRR
jgi:hypothetical protein